MNILPEIELDATTHQAIQILRNSSFPDSAVERSYYKQLPHYRALQYAGAELIGHAGLDYRVINVGEKALKILGIIDFCVHVDRRGQGIGTAMLEQLSAYAERKDVDFIILIADNEDFYIRNGFQQVQSRNFWLRIDEHKNYDVAREDIDDLYIKPVGSKKWPVGDVDWLGSMF